MEDLHRGDGAEKGSIQKGKAGELLTLQEAYLYNWPTGNRSREGGNSQGWKTQTRREMADEMAWWADREMDLLPDPGARHLVE